MKRYNMNDMLAALIDGASAGLNNASERARLSRQRSRKHEMNYVAPNPDLDAVKYASLCSIRVKRWYGNHNPNLETPPAHIFEKLQTVRRMDSQLEKLRKENNAK